MTVHVPDLTCSPYRSTTEYSCLRPPYRFGGATGDDIALEGIHRLLSPSDHGLRLADCGSGPGRIWARSR